MLYLQKAINYRILMKIIPCILVGGLFFLASCFNNTSETQMEQPSLEVEESPAPGYQWYTLRDGRFVPGFYTGAQELRPWPIQDRVAGFARMDNKLYCLINGYGLALFPEQEDEEFDYLYSRNIFQNKTFSRVIAYNQTHYIHLYRDTIFQDGLPEGSRCFYEYLPEDNTLVPFSAPDVSSDPRWQAISLSVEEPGMWNIAWKLVSSNSSQYFYSAYSLDQDQAVELSREDFIQSTALLSPEAAPELLRQLLEEDEVSNAINENDIYVLEVHFQDNGTSRAFLLGDQAGIEDPDVSLNRVYASCSADVTALILPGGQVFLSRSDTGSVWMYTIPRPDDSVRFTAVSIIPGLGITAAWETQEFFQVGDSGLFVLYSEL